MFSLKVTDEDMSFIWVSDVVWKSFQKAFNIRNKQMWFEDLEKYWRTNRVSKEDKTLFVEK